MPRVLILGRTGMLGQTLMHVLRAETRLTVHGTQRINPNDPWFFRVEDGMERLEALLDRQGPYAAVINAIGMLQADIRPEDSASIRQAIAVNALFPHDLAQAVTRTGARLLLISTDGVFSGAHGPYTEEIVPDSPTVYGKTKALGEVYRPGVLTVRCSIIGRDAHSHQGLLEWFLAQPDDAEVSGYADYQWNGVTTLQFAELCRRLIVEGRLAAVCEEAPLHHFCPHAPVSKYEMLLMFQTVFRKDVRIMKASYPEGPRCQVLATRYQMLPALFGRNGSLLEALHALATSEAFPLPEAVG